MFFVHQASTHSPTRKGEHVKRSHLSLKIARAWPRNAWCSCPL